MPVSDLEIVASNSPPPSRELETAEHRIIDVGRLCAAPIRSALRERRAGGFKNPKWATTMYVANRIPAGFGKIVADNWLSGS